MADLQSFNSAIKNTNTQEYLAVVLGNKKESFVTSLVSIVGADKNLQACEPVTLIYAAAKATALGLPIDQNLGQAFVIPFADRKAGKTIATFQIGAKGFCQLAARSGKYKTINVSDVREGEIKGRDRMTGEVMFSWIEDDEERSKRKIIGYVGYFRLINGYEKTVYKTVSELTAHGQKYSMTFRKGFGLWVDNFDAMARKTVVKMLLSKGDAPLSVEMQEAIRYDQSMIDQNGNPNYIDRQQKESAEDQANDFLEDAQVVEEKKADDASKPVAEEPKKEVIYDADGNPLFEE